MEEAATSDVGTLLATARQSRKQGDRNAALAAFEAAAAADAGNRAIDVEIAAELRGLNRLDEAESRLRDVLLAEPRHLAALVEAGRLAHRKARFADAAASFEAAAAIDPQHAGIRIEMARNLSLARRFPEAEAALAALLAEQPRNVDALLERGHNLRRQGDRTAALAAFEEANAIDPRRAGPRLESATELRALGRVDEAETALRQLLADLPQVSAATVSLAYMMLETNRVDEAQALFADARRADPRNLQLTLMQAKIAKRQGVPLEAIEHLRAAIDIAPTDPEARIALAATLREQGDVADAENVIRTVSGLAREPRAILELGRVLRMTDPRRASVAFDDAADAAGADTQVLVAVAREKWAVGEFAAARKLIGRALEADPRSAAAHIAAADFALLSDKPDEALASARAAIEAEPDALAGYLLAARAAAALLDREDAVGALKDAETRLGQRPEILATHIHVLRLFRDYAAARDVAVQSSGETPHAGIWAERVALMLASGDLAGVDAALTSPAPGTEAARVHFYRGRLAEARRDPGEAAGAYGEAVRLRPSQAEWHGDLARAHLLKPDLQAAETALRQSIALSASTRAARGQSVHHSQNFLGQLLDEFALDRGVIGALQAAAELAPRKQVEAIRAIVHANPDNTGAALMLMLAMRRAGQFAFVPSRIVKLTGSKIPRRVVQFWDGEEVPPDVGALMGSWDDPRGGFQHTVFHDRSAREYLAANATPDVASAFNRAHHPAQRADIFRLAYLAKEGGIYADADDRRVAAFDALLPKGAILVGYQEDIGTLANNFIAATPDHPVIRRALDLAVTAVNRGDSDIVWLSTGPGLMTRAFAQMSAERKQAAWKERTLIRELHEMNAVVAIHCPAAYKRTDRHWSRAADRKPGRMAKTG